MSETHIAHFDTEFGTDADPDGFNFSIFMDDVSLYACGL